MSQPCNRAPNSEALIEARDIQRRSGSSRLLRDVSLSVTGGDRIALVGPSGSGKTLLLRALAMLDPLDAGEIRYRGERVIGASVPQFRSRAIYLHQKPSLLEGTVEENLRQPYSLRVHRDKRFDHSRINQLLQTLGRDESFLLKQQRDLSGGEAQLTALLRAIQLQPDVLLLDEPTAALDANATELVESLVSNWLDEQPMQRAMIWVTHDQHQAQRAATTMLRIHQGQLSGDEDGRIY